MASTVSAAYGALFDLLAADPDLAGVQVTYGPPDAYEEQEVVAMMAIEDVDEEPAVIGGPRPRNEEFVIVVGVKVHDPSGTARSVFTRARVLADEVREVVYANQSLTNTLASGWARVASTPTDGAQPAEGGGWVCFVSVRVLCRSRIS